MQEVKEVVIEFSCPRCGYVVRGPIAGSEAAWRTCIRCRANSDVTVHMLRSLINVKKKVWKRHGKDNVHP